MKKKNVKRDQNKYFCVGGRGGLAGITTQGSARLVRKGGWTKNLRTISVGGHLRLCFGLPLGYTDLKAVTIMYKMI